MVNTFIKQHYTKEKPYTPKQNAFVRHLLYGHVTRKPKKYLLTWLHVFITYLPIK